MVRRYTWAFAVAVAAAAVVVVLGPVVTFEWTPNHARFATEVLAAETTDGEVVETAPIETDATLAGISWTGEAPEAAWVRASADGETWTEWLPLGLENDHGPDPGSDEARSERPASDPAYFGPSRYVQYRIQPAEPLFGTASADEMTDALAGISAEIVDTTGRRLPVKDRVMQAIRSVRFGGTIGADAKPTQPAIVGRDAWGADQCLRNTKPRVLPEVHRVDMMFVHHAGNNDYSSGQEARDLVYSICNYHVQVNGWWDIAYNALVDRYGVIYEGRRGGLENPVRGGHTRGFNHASTGVAMLGNFEPGYSGAATPPWQQRQALIDFASWKLDLHHVDPRGQVVVVSEGSSKYAEGVAVNLDRISGHRDGSATACPGQFCYDILPLIRDESHISGGEKIYTDFQDFAPMAGSQASGYTPGTLHLTFTQPVDWTVTISRRLGAVVFQQTGSGTSADVTWDGTLNGDPLPEGPYVVSVTAPGLTWLAQDFKLGSYGWPFVDDEGSYAESSIHSLWIRNLTVGCSWNEYCPDGNLSRGELAAFTSRSMGDDDGLPTYEGYFTDVAQGSWYAPYVEAMHEQGILQAPAGGPFQPLNDADRLTVVVYVIRAIGEDDNLPSYQGYFTDVPQGAWYTPYVERAHELGIALGFEDGTFAPTSSVTREEVAALLMRGFG